MQTYNSDADVERIVERFENCDFGLAEFDHAAHLTVAGWYVSHFGEKGALEWVRAALKRFGAHHGKTGYHETITRFWLHLVAVEIADGKRPVYQLANNIVEKYGNKNLPFEYYSRGRLMSDEAREQWVEPDLRTL